MKIWVCVLQDRQDTRFFHIWISWEKGKNPCIVRPNCLSKNTVPWHFILINARINQSFVFDFSMFLSCLENYGGYFFVLRKLITFLYWTLSYIFFQLITEKTLRCEDKQDFTMNYEFCWDKVSMLEILFYSSYKPSSVFPKLTVHTRGKTFKSYTQQMLICKFKIRACMLY